MCCLGHKSNFLFWKSTIIKMCCLCNHHHSSFWQSQSKWGSHAIHKNFLPWKSSIKLCCLCHSLHFPFLKVWHQMYCLCHSSPLPFLTIQPKMCVLCHSSNFPFLEIWHQNVLLMSPIKISFFGNLASIRVAYVIHQNFLFWKLATSPVAYIINHHSPFWQSQSKMGLPCHPSKFPFLETWHQNVSLMSSIKFSFFGNLASICVAYVIHQIFLFWKPKPIMGSLCHPSNFLF